MIFTKYHFLGNGTHSSTQVGTNDDLIYGMEDAARGLVLDYATANARKLPEVGLVAVRLFSLHWHASRLHWHASRLRHNVLHACMILEPRPLTGHHRLPGRGL